MSIIDKIEKDQEHLELHKLALEFAESHNWDVKMVNAWLSSTFVGQMAMSGYSKEFVKKTLEMMYQKYLDHPLRKENRNSP